jgi:hypothetical protein
MKNLKTILMLVLIFALSLGTQAQGDDSKSDREKVEKSTAPFSMNYFNDESNRYFVMTLQVDKGKVLVNEKAKLVEVRGKFPYQTGNLNVQVLDQQGEKLSSYFMQDQLIVRACEEKEGVTDLLNNGTIQFILPNSNRISSLVLSKNQNEVQRLEVRNVVENYLRRGKPNDDNSNQKE